MPRGKALLIYLGTFFALLVLIAITYKLYIPRINAFGCFDDCFNFLGGYFLIHDGKMYSDFFFNHNPGMGYLSAFVQQTLNPQSIPELILRHRQVMFFLSSLLTLLLYFRFGPIILPFSIVYELSKFYVFGDRFLAEGLVGYLAIYLVATIITETRNEKIRLFDSIVIPIFCFFIIYLREPFSIFSLFALIWHIASNKTQHRNILISSIIFLTLMLFGFLQFNLSDYLFNLIDSNKTLFAHEANSQPLFVRAFKILFYPFYLFFSHESWTIFRTLITPLALLSVISVFIYSRFTKNNSILIFALLSLSLINLRPAHASKMFYETFHIAPYYALVVFLCIYFTYKIFYYSKKAGTTLSLICFVSFFVFSTNKNNFIYERVIPHEEFFTNYSAVMDTGTRIRNLSNPKDTLFVDGYDDLIIWEAKLNSPYQYTWYTSFMPHVDKYYNARTQMFVNNPPDFYYGSCSKSLSKQKDVVSKILTLSYTQINPENDTKCILIHNKKIPQITEEQREDLTNTKYKLPSSQDK